MSVDVGQEETCRTLTLALHCIWSSNHEPTPYSDIYFPIGYMIDAALAAIGLSSAGVITLRALYLADDW